jgi:hypothetical protein
MAARIYAAVSNSKRPGKGHKIFFSLCLAAAVFVLVFSAQSALALGESTPGFAAAVGPIIQVIENTAVWVATGAFTLILTANVLQWVVNNQTLMIQFNGDFIQNGLAATQGLADMLLVLAFVIASFGIIFKVREFEAKKTVTTIVLAAIFTRFGTLIVKMMVDIGNVAINTIVGTNTDLIIKATMPLVNDAIASAGWGIVKMGIFAAALSIPYAHLVAVVAGVGGVGAVGLAFMGYNNPISNGLVYAVVNHIIKWILEIIACYTLSGVYITFILLFLSRVFMISILAVVSPLAIMAYALPQTKNYFRQWWNSLFKWTFLGVWTLFFLMLGLGSAGFIVPTGVAGTSATLGNGLFSQAIIDSGILYYLFLIVYLALVQDMANKESGGVASIFKAAMIGAGAAVMTNAVTPVANRMKERAVENYAKLSSKAATPGASLNLADKIMMHGSGLAAKGLEEKQMANYGSMFSGDYKKAAAGAKTFTKSFDFSKLATKPGEFSNIDPLVDTMISEVGKDNTVESIIAKKDKANLQEAVWAMRNAKTDDLPELMKSLGPNAGTFLNYAIKQGKLSPTQIQSIARNTNALDNSAALQEYFIKKDSSDKENFKKAESFQRALQNIAPGIGLSPDQKKQAEEMTARIMNLKSATHSRDSFKKLSNSVFDNDDNLKAMLIAGPENMFGYAAATSTVADTRLRAAAKANFKSLATANTDLIEAIGRTVFKYRDTVIPDDMVAAAVAAHPGTDDAAREAQNNFIKDQINNMVAGARAAAAQNAAGANPGGNQPNP